MNDIECPRCHSKDMFTGIEYAYGSSNRYDGVSEWVCEACHTRFGRWTKNILTGSMSEPPLGVGK